MAFFFNHPAQAAFCSMTSMARGWSCSTLLAGMEQVVGQTEFLKGLSDEDLMRHLQVTQLKLVKVLFEISFHCTVAFWNPPVQGSPGLLLWFSTRPAQALESHVSEVGTPASPAMTEFYTPSLPAVKRNRSSPSSELQRSLSKPFALAVPWLQHVHRHNRNQECNVFYFTVNKQGVRF